MVNNNQNDETEKINDNYGAGGFAASVAFG
jgi:hypothetical protein